MAPLVHVLHSSMGLWGRRCGVDGGLELNPKLSLVPSVLSDEGTKQFRGHSLSSPLLRFSRLLASTFNFLLRAKSQGVLRTWMGPKWILDVEGAGILTKAPKLVRSLHWSCVFKLPCCTQCSGHFYGMSCDAGPEIFKGGRR